MSDPRPATTQSAIPASRPPSLLRAAGLIALVTVLSKILGAVRDWGIMQVYGASLATDAYFAAFQLPAFSIVLLGGLGGPFHTATVAVFSKLIKDSEAPSPKAKLLASTFITLTGIVFTLLSFAVFLFAEPIMGLILSDARPDLIQSSAMQLKIMSPVILAGGIVGILYGLSNIYHCFFWPSLSPAAMSLAILVGLFVLPPDPTGMMLAWATLAGGILQVLMQLPEFFRQKFSLKPAFQWKTPEIKKVGELLFPATVGTTIGQLVTYVDMFFASALVVGGWSAVTLSNRLIQLPIGVLQTALLVPIFPRFSRYVAEGNLAELKRNFKTGVVSLWLISMPLLVLILLYTEPIIRLIFEHGRFDAEDTRLVTLALVFQAFQIIPYFARDSITRVFYAFHDSKTPMLVGMVAIFLKALLNWFLVKPFGVGGITFAITLITFINMVFLGFLSKRHIADLGFREMVGPFFKLALAGALMALAALLVQAALAPLGLNEFVIISAAASVGLLVYAACALLLRIAEAQYLQERALAILKRRTD